MSKVLTTAEPTRRFSGRKARIAKKLDEKPPAVRKGKKRQAASLIEQARGVPSLEVAREWLAVRAIEDIECVVPDQAGVARGKMMPVQKFLDTPTM